MKRLLILAPLLLSGCTGLGGIMSAPPHLTPQAQTISRSAIDFALNSFDAALYGLDFAMDSHALVPGSDKAKSIAKVGRTVVGFLGVADAAQKLGSSTTYEQAFTNAKSALDEFRALLPAHASQSKMPPMTNEQRKRILDRLDGAATI